jgi:hypothetical protein
VPTNAISKSGQKFVLNAKPSPVAAINSAAASTIRRRECRFAIMPIHNVISAVPINVLVTIAPTANALKPSSMR